MIYKTIILLTIILLIIILLSNCSFKNDKILNNTEIIETNWGIIRNIEFYDGKFFVLDVSADVFVWVYDKNFKELYSFGVKGRGPSEIGLPENFIIEEDNVYILDKMLKSIKIFQLNGVFVDSILLENTSTPVSFCKIDENFYITSAVSNNFFSIKVYNNEGNLISEFGKKKFKSDNVMLDNIKNLSAVYLYDNKVFQFPIFASSHFYVYSIDETSIAERELDLPFQIVFNSNQKDIYEGNIGTTIFNDALVINNDICVLLGGGTLQQKNNDIYLCLLKGNNQVFYKINVSKKMDDISSRYLRMTLVGNEIYIISPDWDFLVKVDIEKLL